MVVESFLWNISYWSAVVFEEWAKQTLFVSVLACKIVLKALDTIGNSQRLAFTVGVSQHMHKRNNLWKFELNRSSKLRDNNERRKHPCYTNLCAFRWLISRPQVLNLWSQNQTHGKLLLSQKLWHLRGSRFSQCFKPSNARPQESFYANNCFEWLPIVSTAINP